MSVIAHDLSVREAEATAARQRADAAMRSVQEAYRAWLQSKQRASLEAFKAALFRSQAAKERELEAFARLRSAHQCFIKQPLGWSRS
jgi:hypothetical protein